VVGELHRNGVLGLIHLHWLSLTNMRGLAERTASAWVWRRLRCAGSGLGRLTAAQAAVSMTLARRVGERKRSTTSAACGWVRATQSSKRSRAA
jgi:hypothetical protein